MAHPARRRDVPPVAPNMRKSIAFRFLGDDYNAFCNVADPAAQWRILETDNDEHRQNKKARQLAAILVNLKQDIETMDSTSAGGNFSLQDKYSKVFHELYPQKDYPLPEIRYQADENIDTSNVELINKPTLGPLKDETNLEPFNRCWQLMKYFRAIIQAKKKFAAKLSSEGFAAGSTIRAQCVPDWMQPSRATGAEAIPKRDIILEADALPPKSFTLFWNRKLENSGESGDELNTTLELASQNGVEFRISCHQTGLQCWSKAVRVRFLAQRSGPSSLEVRQSQSQPR